MTLPTTRLVTVTFDVDMKECNIRFSDRRSASWVDAVLLEHGTIRYDHDSEGRLLDIECEWGLPNASLFVRLLRTDLFQQIVQIYRSGKPGVHHLSEPLIDHQRDVERRQHHKNARDWGVVTQRYAPSERIC